MVSRSLLAACSLAAAFCLNFQAQSTPSQPAITPAQSGQPAPAQTKPATPPLQLQDLPPDPHTLSPAEQEQLRQQQILNAAMRLATMQAHWGPEMSTPGLSIALAEVRRTKTPEGTTQITYQITGSGFSPDEKLSLVRWPLNTDEQTLMSGINFDAKGVAVCAAAPAPAQPASPAATAPGTSQQAGGLTAAPAPNAAGTPSIPPAPSCSDTMQLHQPVEIQTTAAPGEAIRVALMDVDRKHGAAVSTVPFPIANADKGCKLEVVLGIKDASLVLIEGTGFPPKAPLKLDLITGPDTRTLHPTTSANGRMVVPILTGAKGQDSGETTVRFGGINHVPTLETSSTPPPPDPDCAPSVSFHWGNGSYKME